VSAWADVEHKFSSPSFNCIQLQYHFSGTHYSKYFYRSLLLNRDALYRYMNSKTVKYAAR